MKKLLNQLLLFSALGGLIFMASCGSDDSEDVVPVPELFVTTSPLTGADDTVRVEVNSSVTITADVVAAGGINSIRISDGVNTIDSTRANSSIQQGDQTASITFPSLIYSTAGVATITVTAVDDLGQATEDVVVVRVSGQPVTEYTATLLGGQLNSTTGSFYNAITDDVYFLSAAGTNDDMIDLAFYYVATDGLRNMIAAPDNAEVQTTFETSASWPLVTENSTRFKPLDGSFDYDAISLSSELENSYPEVGAEQERMLDLQVGQVFAFQLDPTRGDRYGIIEVASIDGTSGTNRSITINVKIQPEDN